MGRIIHSLLLLGAIFAETSAFAQRLVIQSPSAGPVTRVIYGKVSDKKITVFEKAYAFEMDQPAVSNQPDTLPEGTPPAEAAKPSSTTTALTSFTLKPEDVAACVNSPRLRGFLELAKALKAKINSVAIAASADADECAAKVSKSLSSILKDAQISSSTANTDGVRVELGVTSTVAIAGKDSDKPSTPIEASPVSFASLEDLIKNLKIVSGEREITPNTDGYFALEVENNDEVAFVISLRGRKTIKTTAFPILVGLEAAPVLHGEDYAARVAEFNQPKLNVVINETPFLAKKTTLDGGIGGGYGYGRQVPGEKRGQRMVSLLGIERRGIFGDFGARGGLFYTRAPASVVPQTFTARASAFYDWSIIDDGLTMRFGGGFEVFSAQIKYKKTGPTETVPAAALIPQEVSAPLVSWSIHTVLFNRVVFSPTIVYTPLYVASIGFYPSVSPALEIGYKFKHDWILMAQTGSETHRFPSIAGETKLQMDYGIITLKRGLF